MPARHILVKINQLMKRSVFSHTGQSMVIDNWVGCGSMQELEGRSALDGHRVEALSGCEH